ncbi:MAG: radical SAM protein [Elusimicrobia bacterium]|nr:radical SAM protein [Elusimicrobiota bacterium]
MPEPSAPSLLSDLQAKAEASSTPLTMVLELTHRCNLGCRHCYLPSSAREASREQASELSLDEWKRVLGELAVEGTLFLTFTGGEALLRKDLGSILETSRGLNFHVELFTNATLLTPGDADLWSRLGVAGVGVSVYGPDSPGHDRVTGAPGSFDRTLAGIKLLRERGIPVRFKVPLMRSNASSYRAILALAQSLGATWQVDPLLTPANDGSDIPSRLGLDDEALSSAFRDPLLCSSESLASAQAPGPDDSACSAGRTFAAIGPCGDVYPCLQWLESAGNTRTASFRSIWQHSALLLDARGRAWKDLKPCPTCAGSHYSHCPGLAMLEHQDPAVPPRSSCRLTAAMRATT